MNKKLLTLGLAIIMFTTVFVGCKKGDNDPMSFATRKSRIAGEWKLSEASTVYATSYNNGDNYTMSSTFNGTSMTRTIDGNGDAYVYSEEITIKKDGTFTSVESEQGTYYDGNGEGKTGTRTITKEGVWYFVDGNKEQEVKNKERVEFTTTRATIINYNGDTSIDTYSGKSNSQTQTLLLDRLAKKEMIVLFDSKSSVSGNTTSESGTKTYTQ